MISTMSFRFAIGLLLAVTSFFVDMSFTEKSNCANKESEFENRELLNFADSVALMIASKDTQSLTDLVHPELGLQVLYIEGIYGQVTSDNHFPDELIYSDYYPFESNDFESGNILLVDQQDMPKFDCSEMNWSKQGSFFCKNDSSQILIRYLIDTYRTQDRLEEAHIQEIENTLEQISKNSYWSVHTAIGDFGLVFLVFEESGNYYVGMIDLMDTDCSA